VVLVWSGVGLVMFALMDYGAMLPKKIGKNANVQSKHYILQSKFKGSDREIRGAILKLFQAHKKISQNSAYALFPKEKVRVIKILNLLEKEGMLKKHGTAYKLP
jgi:A/G-specific adenine glycosylase